MRVTPMVVLMPDDLIAALEDDVHDLETRISAQRADDPELNRLCERNGWDDRMMAYGLVYKRYVVACGAFDLDETSLGVAGPASGEER